MNDIFTVPADSYLEITLVCLPAGGFGNTNNPGNGYQITNAANTQVLERFNVGTTRNVRLAAGERLAYFKTTGTTVVALRAYGTVFTNGI